MVVLSLGGTLELPVQHLKLPMPGYSDTPGMFSVSYNTTENSESNKYVAVTRFSL